MGIQTVGKRLKKGSVNLCPYFLISSTLSSKKKSQLPRIGRNQRLIVLNSIQLSIHPSL